MFDKQPNLASDLVKIRPLRLADFESLYAVACDPLIWEQHPEPKRYERKVFEVFFRAALESEGALIVLGASNGLTIGSSRFNAYDEARSEIEIGWTFLSRSHWGGRYNGDLKRLMLQHAFVSVENVVFVVGSKNRRSQLAVEKIGGQRSGSRFDSGAEEKFVYELTRDRYASICERVYGSEH